MEHLLQNCPYQIFNIQNVIWNEKIGEGVHERTIIDVNRFDKRVTAKIK